MRIFLLLFVVTLLATVSRAQVKPPLAVEDLKEGLNPVDEIRFFDLEEIKMRKIDTAYIIYHPASWGDTCDCINQLNDTISINILDKEGRIIQKTIFRPPRPSHPIFIYDSLSTTTETTMFKRSGTNAGL